MGEITGMMEEGLLCSECGAFVGVDSEEANPMKADPYRNQMVINQTVNVANQLHKAMKLKLDTVKVFIKFQQI